ncbi:MAG: hypothetical protein Q7S34_03835, partial [bacterium]|nr:hypothetical protein [bacterium]
GTYFVQFGDVKYIFAYNGTPQHVVMSGYDTGTFTFEIWEFQGDTGIASTVFRDVPVTPQTQVRFDVLSGFGSASDLAVDENGDGTVDSSYASSTGQIIVPDVPAVESAPAAPVPVPVVGGGGIPSLLPQGVSANAIVATTTSVIAATTSGNANIPQEQISTSTVQVVVQSQPKKTPQIAISIPTKKKTNVVAASVSKEPEPNLQVASVAQVTGDGLWLRVRHWIMNKINTLFKL